MEKLVKSVAMVKHNQFIKQLLQLSQEAELKWSTFNHRWQQRQLTLLAAVRYFTTIDHVSTDYVI